MARTHYVKSFRGQRTCQHQAEGSWSKCGKGRDDHPSPSDLAAAETLGLLTPEYVSKNWTVTDHPFTQSPLRCQRCGKDINIGDPYKWVAPRAHRASRGVKKVRCMECPGWKPSELTSSPVLSILYAVSEDFDFSGVNEPASLDEVEDVADQLRAVLSAAAEQVREAAEMRTEAADNIEDGFGHETYQSSELREQGDELEQWADEMDSWDPPTEPDEDEDEDEDELADRLREWFESAVDDAQSYIDDIPMP
jgi:hypothetical protein